MASQTKVEFFCDFCQRKLATSNNRVEISTDLSCPGSSKYRWARLHIKLEVKTGIDNQLDPSRHADLCKACAYSLLQAASIRVAGGERVTKGIDSCLQQEFREIED